MKGILSRMMPARSATQAFEPVADLDAVLTRPKAVKVFGRWRPLKNLTTEEFMQYLQNVGAVISLKETTAQDETQKARQVVDAYCRVFQCVLPDLSRKEVERLTFQQVVSLFGHIVRAVTGDVSGKTVEEIDGGAQKKSPPTSPNSTG